MTTIDIVCLVGLYLTVGVFWYSLAKSYFHANHDILVCIALMITWPAAILGVIVLVPLIIIDAFGDRIARFITSGKRDRKEKKR